MPLHSGPFDDTDPSQDAEALTKHKVWLENTDSVFCENTQREVVCMFTLFAVVYWQDCVSGNLISIDTQSFSICISIIDIKCHCSDFSYNIIDLNDLGKHTV